MQAIFLTEVFGRFRSQKIDVRPSSAFRRLYKMVSSLILLKHALTEFLSLWNRARQTGNTDSHVLTFMRSVRLLNSKWKTTIRMEHQQLTKKYLTAFGANGSTGKCDSDYEQHVSYLTRIKSFATSNDGVKRAPRPKIRLLKFPVQSPFGMPRRLNIGLR
jgi:hypothetical protein